MPQSKPEPLQALEHREETKDGVLAKARIRITRKGSVLLDEDNLHGSVKPLLDGLCKAGLIQGDSPKDIDLEVAQQKVSRKECGTLIEIL
jgi:hypothetical protein